MKLTTTSRGSERSSDLSGSDSGSNTSAQHFDELLIVVIKEVKVRKGPFGLANIILAPLVV